MFCTHLNVIEKLGIPGEMGRRGVPGDQGMHVFLKRTQNLNLLT